MDLDSMIDAAVAGLPRGRRGAPSASPSYVRDIQAEDLPTIMANPAPPQAERPMLRIRHQHHMAAKLIAEGRRPAEVSLITGYTTARLGQLQRDPTFQELVTFYKDAAGEKWLNVHERLAALGITVTEELQARLEDEPEEFSNEELRKLAETLLDRSGYGPQSTKNVNLKTQSLSVTLVEQIKRESRPQGTVQLLEHTDSE